MEDKFITKIMTLVVIGLLFILGFLILRPILIAIILALIFAYVFIPVYKKINKYIKNPNLATITLILLILIVIAIPLWFLIPIIIRQTFDTFIALQGIDLSSNLQKILPSLIEPETARTITIHFNNLIGTIFSSFLNQFTLFLVNIPSFLLQVAIFLFTFYFAVRDSDKLKGYMASLSPFSGSTEKKFLSEFRHITNAIVFGQVLIGILQGLALGIGLFILGVPKALILTLVATILSIIPILGPFLVWLPVSIYLLVTGSTFSGIFLLLYGALFVSSIDNILRPVLLSRKSELPVVLGIIGTIGGLYYFGIIGLVLGPLILAYILIIFEFYKQGKLNDLFKK